MYNYQTNPAPYVPYSRRTFSDPDPQRNPEWFTTKDVRKEVRMLIRMNMKYGSNPLRTIAYTKLETIIRARGE